MTGSDSAEHSADNLKLVNVRTFTSAKSREENGDGLRTRQSLDGHSSTQTQHRTTLFYFFAYNFGILTSVSVSWLRKAVTEL